MIFINLELEKKKKKSFVIKYEKSLSLFLFFILTISNSGGTLNRFFQCKKISEKGLWMIPRLIVTIQEFQYC